MNDLAELSMLRRQYNDLEISPKAIQVFTDQYLTSQIARRLTDLSDHRDGVRNMLGMAKELITQKLQEPQPKRYELCLHVLLAQFMMSFLLKAQEEYRPDKPEAFICFYDVANGIEKALMLLVCVQYELHGETAYRQWVHNTDPNRFSKPPDVDEYAWSKRENWAKRVVEAIDRLQHDPSGFSLLDESVAEVHEYYHDKPNGRLVIAGAESAQKIYKALYPLTEGI